MAKSVKIKPNNNVAVSDATKVKPSFQEIDYLYNVKIPFGTSNPYVPKYQKKQADAQFENQKQSSVIKKTSKQQIAQNALNKIKLGNNDLGNTILDFVKSPAQSGINLTDVKINNDEDVLKLGEDVLNILPVVGASAKMGIEATRFGKNVYRYGKQAHREAKVITDAEKLNSRLLEGSSYKQIKEVPEKIRRIGNIWEKPSFSKAEELDKLQKLKKLNVEDSHLEGITGLNKKGIDDRIEELTKTNSSNLHMPENPTLDDLTNLITYQNRNSFDQNVQNYIDTHLTNFENRATSQRRVMLDAESREALNTIREPGLNTRGSDLDADIDLTPSYDNIDISDFRDSFRELISEPSQLRNLNLDFLSNLKTNKNNIPNWLKNTIDKSFNKGLISKVNPEKAVISTNPSLFRSSGNVEEQLRETQKMIDFYPSETRIKGASSLSDSSFPLVIANMKKNILNKNLKNVEFEGYNNLNHAGYLNKAQIHPDVIVPYLNSHIDELSKILGKKIPKAYYDEDGIKYPDLIGVKMKKGGRILKDIGATGYGVFEGALDASTFNMTDSITDMGAKELNVDNNAYRSAGNIGGAVGMDFLTMGMTHAGSTQQILKGTNGVIQNTDLMGNNEKQYVGKGLNFLRTAAPLIGGIEDGSVNPSQVIGAAQGASELAQPIQKYKFGGEVNKTIINVEKGELEVNPNDLKIIKEFRNKPKHPSIGIDEQGNTMATVDNIIIPKKMNQLYKKGSILQKKAIINNLQFDQAKRDGTKYAFGGAIKKYDGSNGSVVTPGPRVDGGYYNFDNSFAPSNPIMTNTSGMFNFNLANNSGNYTPLMTSKGLNMDYTNMSNREPSISAPTRGLDMTNVNMNYSAEPSKNDLAYKPSNSTTPSFDWNNAAGKALEYSPAIYNLGRGLFDKPLQLNEKDYLVNDQLNPPVLTGESGRRDMLKAYNLAKYNNRQTNGNQAGMNNLFGKYSDSLASFNENLENKNKVAKFEADKYGIENKFKNASTRLNLKQFNEQNKAAKRDFTSKGLTQASDIYQNERNNEIMSRNLPNFLKYYDYDENNNLILKSNKRTKV